MLANFLASYAIAATAAALPSALTEERLQLSKRDNSSSASTPVEVVDLTPALTPPFPVIPEVNQSQPRFQVYDDEFYNVLGDKPVLRRVVSNPTYAFAHEAPIYVSDTNEVFFASNAGGDLGRSGLNASNRVLKIDLGDITEGETADLNITAHFLPLDENLQNVNGGTPYKGNLLFATEGRGEDRPPSLVLVSPYEPYNSTVLLNNFFGRQFNSLNDVVAVPGGDAVLFTDPTYGALQDFRPPPSEVIRIQTYRFDPSAGDLRAITDLDDEPNGILLSPDNKRAYIADTGAARGYNGTDYSRPATIYQYDVLTLQDGTQRLVNRQLFAYIDAGFADGIKSDENGCVFAGTGDGVHVFSPYGKLLGKIYLGSTSANLAFVPGGLIILAQTEIYYAELGVKGKTLDYYRGTV